MGVPVEIIGDEEDVGYKHYIQALFGISYEEGEIERRYLDMLRRLEKNKEKQDNGEPITEAIGEVEDRSYLDVHNDIVKGLKEKGVL